jgi:hypothetical protein
MSSSALLIDGDKRKAVSRFGKGATQRMNLRWFAAIAAEENESAKIMGLGDFQFGPCELIIADTHHQHLTDLDLQFLHDYRLYQMLDHF